MIACPGHDNFKFWPDVHKGNINIISKSTAKHLLFRILVKNKNWKVDGKKIHQLIFC